MTNWLAGTWAVFEKDVRLELRDRYGINALLMFVLSSLMLVAFGIGREPLGFRVQSALLWIVILFGASIGLARSFVSEEERGTTLLLQLNVRASMVYAGKLLYNFVLVLLANVVALLAFILLLRVSVANLGVLLATLVLGSLGLSGTTTLLAAIIARTANRGPLLPVLLFPLLIPLLLAVISGTQSALTMQAGAWTDAVDELSLLIGFTGVIITVSSLLFDHVWND